MGTMSMEIPDNLKGLYRHWDFHTNNIDLGEAHNLFEDKKLYENVSWFIQERTNIWKKKTKGEQAPFTSDAVLATYRFCNIFREFDRQTVEFHTVLNPFRGNFPVWLLNMFYCRMVARTETIKAAGLLSFNKEENKKVYDRLMQSPRPRFGTPYVFPVSVIQRSATPTREQFIAEYLPSVMNSIAKEITTWKRKSVYDAVEKLLPLFTYNLRFLWTEVLIDVAYQYPHYIDLFGRFPVGPGSLPTIKKIDSAEDPSILVTRLAAMPFDTGLTVYGKSLRLSAENWEGIGCEYRKYTNLSFGRGRKRIYRVTI